MRRRERGYSLIEMVVALAVFGAIVAIFAILSAEIRDREKRTPINLMRHPQVSAVVSRMRRDVQDAYGPKPYLKEHDGYTMDDPRILIVVVQQPNGGIQTVVWDLREKGVVRRRAYNVGVATDWFARGLPAGAEFDLDAVDIQGRPYGVRLKMMDAGGRLAIDQILQPRAH
jgi:prepilin-type N-terminal cleavage/methylation domain-containing protein